MKIVNMNRAKISAATTTIPGLPFGFPYGSALARESVLKFVEFWGYYEKPSTELKESTQLWRYEADRTPLANPDSQYRLQSPMLRAERQVTAFFLWGAKK
jgi:hypothetical protein